MSNAMRLGKRTLAGAAAGALALGMLTIASAPAATAAPSIKPKAAITATVNAVRPTLFGTAAALDLPAASMSWSGAQSTLAQFQTATIDLTTAPTATAGLYFVASADETVTLNTDKTMANVTFGVTNYTTDDSQFNFRVTTAGNYAGQIYNGIDTVSFSFATAGAPASMQLLPATQTVLVGAQADLAVTLLDASGKPTQPQNVDRVTLTSTDDTLSRIDAANGVATITQLTSSQPVPGNLATGTGYFSLNTGPTAGTTTITATPAGTLGASGVTAQTATVTKSGTVSSTAVANISVTTPANAINTWTAGDSINWTGRQAYVPEGTTSITVTVDDTTSATAGNRVRLAISTSQGTVNGATSTQYVDLTTNASKQATTTITLGGLAVTNGTVVTVRQVSVTDAQVNFASSQAVSLPITVLTPTVNAASTTVSPPLLVTKIGTSVPINITVEDTFGTPMSGWTVQAYRGNSVTGAFLGQGVTNAAGKTTVNVTNASTVTTQTSEVYSYKITGPGGATFNDLSANQVTYTTTGTITTLSAQVGSGTACSTAAACSPTTYGAVRIASAGIVSGTNSSATQAVSTGTITRGNGSNMIELAITTSPTNVAVVTVPEGVKVSDEAPTATTLWSAGGQTATVLGTAYIWATKTGLHDITVTSGGLTQTVKLRVYNIGGDAYNIALTPAKQSLATGSIGTATLKVTDIFGNPVQTGLADDSGTVAITAAGDILLAGYDTTRPFVTNASGEATVTIIAANAIGTGTLTAVPSSTTTTTAWVAGYKPPTGAPAPVVSAVAEVAVGAGPATKSITITGSRTTVSGKPGIRVDGVVTGIENGKTVIPYFRFPGETTFAQGTARPVITDGGFSWQRKTGKKFYAYVTSDDGVTKSNRVIIPAN